MLNDLLARNRDWSARRHAEEPDFFPGLPRNRPPQFFWIGWPHSRVRANMVAGLLRDLRRGMKLPFRTGLTKRVPDH